MEPVGVCLIVGHLKSLGINASIYDGFLKGESCKNTARGILDQKPDIIGISMNAEREVSDGIQLCDNLRLLEFKGTIIGGGAFASLQQERLLTSEKFDYIVVGDGEEAIVELLSHLKGEIVSDVINGIASRKNFPAIPRRVIPDLDSVGAMDRTILKQMIECNGNSTAGLQATITTGRGCFANCSFCSIQTFAKMSNGARYRERKISNIIEEMKALYAEFGLKDFYFCSGQFLSMNEKSSLLRTKQLRIGVEELPFKPSIFLYIRCDNVQRQIIKNLRSSGVTTIFLGVESFHDQSLEQLNKRLRSEQIIRGLEILEEEGYSSDYRSPLRLKLGFIMFTPWIDKNGLLRNLEYCIKFKIPPKKMLYSLQIHPEHTFQDSSFKIVRKDNAHFVDFKNEIEDIYKCYSKFFNSMFLPLEKLRAIQKANIDHDDELIKWGFEIIDAMNKEAYLVFRDLIHASDTIEKTRITIKSMRKIAEILEFFRYEEFLQKVIDSSKKDKRDFGISSHFNRGLDNPQVTNSTSVEYILRYP
jgi:radical SAM superfamily enzyme YgiQ (UPF0313 family)